LLVKNEWQSASLTELVRAQLAHFGDLLDARIAVHGPELRIKSAAALDVLLIGFVKARLLK
jgi:hypothetical protein